MKQFAQLVIVFFNTHPCRRLADMGRVVIRITNSTSRGYETSFRLMTPLRDARLDRSRSEPGQDALFGNAGRRVYLRSARTDLHLASRVISARE